MKNKTKPSPKKRRSNVRLFLCVPGQDHSLLTELLDDIYSVCVEIHSNKKFETPSKTMTSSSGCIVMQKQCKCREVLKNIVK